MSGILDQPARKLSADQKQLTSLGRGLVRDDVSAVLLDEPLTVIDPQMKFDLRRKLREINRSTGITMILVTHDQAEAMSFADEVVVMKDGHVQQSGPPEELFARPRNEFVGYFIGSPPLNLFAVQSRGGALHCPALGVDFEPKGGARDLATVRAGVRPEHIHLEEEVADLPRATIETIENLGIDRVFSLKTSGGAAFKVKSRRNKTLTQGDEVSLSVSPEDILLFDNGQRVECLASS